MLQLLLIVIHVGERKIYVYIHLTYTYHICHYLVLTILQLPKGAVEKTLSGLFQMGEITLGKFEQNTKI